MSRPVLPSGDNLQDYDDEGWSASSSDSSSDDDSEPKNRNPDGVPDPEPSSKPTRESVTPRCNACAKPQASSSVPLQRCGKCHAARYCSRECQKADWPIHKRICNQSGAKPEATKPVSAMNSMIRMMSLQGGPNGKVFAKIGDGTYLESLREKDAFAQIIDSYRLRIEDEYKFRGDAGGLYAGEDPLPDFRHYLERAEKKGGVLPKWWSREKRKACEKMAVDEAQWSDVNSAVEKADIMEHYGDNMMPMKLRMLAEKVEGSNVTGM
ncbi:hypothetical protein MMC17_005887 [Xylographa soralifera]|nr:hypothetical protein [Xylographa soralifera]